jgi:hypothetical protein
VCALKPSDNQVAPFLFYRVRRGGQFFNERDGLLQAGKPVKRVPIASRQRELPD